MYQNNNIFGEIYAAGLLSIFAKVFKFPFVINSFQYVGLSVMILMQATLTKGLHNADIA